MTARKTAKKKSPTRKSPAKKSAATKKAAPRNMDAAVRKFFPKRMWQQKKLYDEHAHDIQLLADARLDFFSNPSTGR